VSLIKQCDKKFLQYNLSKILFSSQKHSFSRSSLLSPINLSLTLTYILSHPSSLSCLSLTTQIILCLILKLFASFTKWGEQRNRQNLKFMFLIKQCDKFFLRYNLSKILFSTQKTFTFSLTYSLSHQSLSHSHPSSLSCISLSYFLPPHSPVAPTLPPILIFTHKTVVINLSSFCLHRSLSTKHYIKQKIV
jgi:hypothetical protein